MIALIDCNNFFVSCERVFQPRLRGVPSLVMSSNDGCVIARSQEAKAIGIPMGIPIFKVRDWIRQHDIQLRSTNFALYHDMSGRVMRVIKSMTERCQVYSVDEAFFEIPDGENPYLFSKKIQEAIIRRTGIPTSVGVATTKTLAKLANKRAKKSRTHVYVLNSERKRLKLLAQTSAGEIWGIGRGFAERLLEAGIRSAYDLTRADDARVRSIFGVHGIHSAYELRGIPCLEIETEAEPRKSMISSRSFGKTISNRKELWNSVAFHVNSLAEDLRAEGQVAQRIRIGLYVNRFRDDRGNSGSDERILRVPTSDTKTLLRTAQEIFDGLYVPGRAYSKSGATLSSLSPEDRPVQESLFADAQTEETVGKLDGLMDELNAKHGAGKVMLGEMLNPSKDESWRPRSSMRSQEYTTSWDQILTIGTT